MVYGYTVERDGPDPLVELVDKALDNFAASTVPGSWFVDLIPARKLVVSFSYALLSITLTLSLRPGGRGENHRENRISSFFIEGIDERERKRH